jgi:hypothetical protein
MMPEVNLDRAGAVNDNAAALRKRASQGGKKHGGMAHGAGQGVPQQGKPSHQQEATSMPGSMGILDLAHHEGHKKHAGIPGILHTTTEGPSVRHKLLSGILDLSAEHGRKPDGPVHSVTGHDATARNAGMRPIPGSPFR